MVAVVGEFTASNPFGTSLSGGNEGGEIFNKDGYTSAARSSRGYSCVSPNSILLIKIRSSCEFSQSVNTQLCEMRGNRSCSIIVAQLKGKE